MNRADTIESRRDRERSASRSGVHVGLEPVDGPAVETMSFSQAIVLLRDVAGRVPDPVLRAQASRACSIVYSEVQRLRAAYRNAHFARSTR